MQKIGKNGSTDLLIFAIFPSEIEFRGTSETSGRPNQVNTELTEPDRSGNIYRTGPYRTEPHGI